MAYQMKQIIFILLISILCINNVVAYYPPTIYRNSVDIERLDNILQIIPEDMFKGIERLEFSTSSAYSNEPQFESYIDNNLEDVYSVAGHYDYNYRYEKYSGDIISFSNSRITINNAAYQYSDNQIKCILLHELGHHYSYITLKTQTNIYNIEETNYYKQEKIATDYAVKYDEECEWLYI